MPFSFHLVALAGIAVVNFFLFFLSNCVLEIRSLLARTQGARKIERVKENEGEREKGRGVEGKGQRRKSYRDRAV